MLQKILILLFVGLLMSCGRSYINPSQGDEDVLPVMTILNTYSGVDSFVFSFSYNDFNFDSIQIRRDTIEVPPTIYDGDLVFLNSDIPTIFDDANVSPNVLYNYSLFYAYDDVWKHATNFSERTLSYREGMQQLVLEAMNYARSKNIYTQFIISGNDIDIMFSEDQVVDDSILSNNLMSLVDGVLIKSLNYLDSGSCQENPLSNELYQKIDLLSQKMPSKLKLAVDYCEDLQKINTSRIQLSAYGIKSYSRSTNTNNVFITPQNMNVESISSLSDQLLSNFVFLDLPVNNLMSSLNSIDYDLIILTPFSEYPVTSIDHRYSKSSIQSLKSKSNGNRRLVFAYLNVGRASDMFYYWQPEWDVMFPEWILNQTQVSTQYTIKYWGSSWRDDILFPIIDKIVALGFDGIVIDGISYYKDWSAQ